MVGVCVDGEDSEYAVRPALTRGGQPSMLYERKRLIKVH